ncbi:hypothetical protein [Streptomyces sp. NPDC059761]|uniref:hypothetical protein n=1 Tax=Streptomyces sp. NPDC059761 TaxID=3346937 RepID=UPI0036543A30
MDDQLAEIFERAGLDEPLGVNEVTRADLVKLAGIQTRKAMLAREEAEIVNRLVQTRVSGIRSIVATVLDISTETLRVRFPSRR